MMAKGAWTGVLKDEIDLSACKIIEGNVRSCASGLIATSLLLSHATCVLVLFLPP
jgi:hypothetical protein